MVSALLIGIQSKFSYTKRWAMLNVAGERVASEIYLYRARVGEYSQRTKDAKLLKLIDGHRDETLNRKVRAPDVGSPTENLKPEGDASAEKEVACDDAPPTSRDTAQTEQARQRSSKKPAVKNPAPKQASARDMFYENFNGIQSEMMASEVKMAALQKPPPSRAKALLGLYDPLERREQTKKMSLGGDSAGDYEEADSGAQTDALLALEEGKLSDFSLLGNAMEDDDDAANDGIGLISAEDYIRIRLMPAVGRLNEKIGWQGRRKPGHEFW